MAIWQYGNMAIPREYYKCPECGRIYSSEAFGVADECCSDIGMGDCTTPMDPIAGPDIEKAKITP